MKYPHYGAKCWACGKEFRANGPWFARHRETCAAIRAFVAATIKEVDYDAH